MPVTCTPDGVPFGTFKGEACDACFSAAPPPQHRSLAQSGTAPPWSVERDLLPSKLEFGSYISCARSCSCHFSSRHFYLSMDPVTGIPLSDWPGGHWWPMPVQWPLRKLFSPVPRSYCRHSYSVTSERCVAPNHWAASVCNSGTEPGTELQEPVQLDPADQEKEEEFLQPALASFSSSLMRQFWDGGGEGMSLPTD